MLQTSPTSGSVPNGSSCSLYIHTIWTHARLHASETALIHYKHCRESRRPICKRPLETTPLEQAEKCRRAGDAIETLDIPGLKLPNAGASDRTQLQSHTAIQNTTPAIIPEEKAPNQKQCTVIWILWCVNSYSCPAPSFVKIIWIISTFFYLRIPRPLKHKKVEERVRETVVRHSMWIIS